MMGTINQIQISFDMSDIELLDDESQVGLIDQDETQFPEPDQREEGHLSERLLDITYDTFFGDLGTINDIEFYTPDFTLPYTYKMAKQSCDKEERLCEMNLKLQENIEYKIKTKLRVILMSWFFKNFGENDFEISMGCLLENYWKNKIKIKKGEEKINGHILISDGNDYKLYKTQIFSLTKRKSLSPEKKQKLDSYLWDGLESKVWIEENKNKDFFYFYKPVKFNLKLLSYVLESDNLNIFTFPNQYSIRTQKKLQESLSEEDI